jgi:hypothetical protein
VVGQRLAPHLPELRLRQGFAALLIGSALLTGYQAWQRHGHSPGVSRAAPSRQPLLPPGLSAVTVSPLLLCAAAPPPTRHG